MVGIAKWYGHRANLWKMQIQSITYSTSSACVESIALLLLHCSRRRRELFAADETTLLHHVNKACEILWQVLACLAGRVKRFCGEKQLNITAGYETGPSSRSTYFGCGLVTINMDFCWFWSHPWCSSLWSNWEMSCLVTCRWYVNYFKSKYSPLDISLYASKTGSLIIITHHSSLMMMMNCDRALSSSATEWLDDLCLE